MVEAAALAISKEAQVDIEPRIINDRAMLGNQRGLNLIEDLSECKVRLQHLEEKDAKREIALEGLQRSLSELGVLQTQSELLQQIRHGFISTYKRDKLGEATPEDEMIIGGEGNGPAHKGDVLTDCRLYGNETRMDCTIFQSLYGVPPGFVRFLQNKKPIIKLLNDHATIVASRLRIHGPLFTVKFDKFIITLMKVIESKVPFDGEFSNAPPALATAWIEYLQQVQEGVHAVEE